MPYSSPCGVCGGTPTRQFQFGHRCVPHAPRVPTPDPERTVEYLRRQPASFQPVAYGQATTDPLGREGEGWHKSKQTLLPVKTKAAK